MSFEAWWLSDETNAVHRRPLYSVAREARRPNVGLREQKILSLSYGQIVRRDVDSGTGLLPASFETYNVIKPDEVVLRLTDLQNDKRSLRTGFVREPGAVTSAYVTLKFDERLIDPRYGHYYLYALDVQKVFYQLGGGVRQSLSFDDLRHLPVPTPSRRHQQRIADFLDRETHRVDALVDAKRRMIDLLEEKRLAFRDRILGDLSPDLVTPLKRRALATVGIVVQPAQLYADDGVPVLRGLNVGEGEVNRIDLRFISFEANRAHSKSILHEGDVVVVRTGQAGAAAVVPDWAVGGNCVDLLLVRPGTGLDSKYLAYWLNSGHTSRQVEEFSVGAIQSHYNVGALNELDVAVPPLNEQQRIVRELDRREGAMRATSSRLRRQLDLLAEYRQALITQAVTGQLDDATLKGDKPVGEAVGVIPE